MVKAPPGANKARVCCMALEAGGTGKVRWDRVSVQQAQKGEGGIRAATVLRGPSPGLEVRIDARGTLRFHRQKLELAEEVGLVLDPANPLTTQSTARIDQPLARQTDQSLLALGSIIDLKKSERVEYTFTARPGAATTRVRWSLAPTTDAAKTVTTLNIQFKVHRFGDLGDLVFDEKVVKRIPKDGVLYEKVREMVWGKGEHQIAFGLLTPTRRHAAPAQGRRRDHRPHPAANRSGDGTA